MVFGVLGYISALSTLLLPASANLGFGWILIIRVIQGKRRKPIEPLNCSLFNGDPINGKLWKSEWKI